MEKADVRKMMRVRKRELTLEEKLRRSEPIMRQVEALPEFQRARTVLLYWSMEDEVQTHFFVDKWYRDKVLLLPCVDGDNLRLRQYTGPECMVAGEQFGIGEPASRDRMGAAGSEEFTDLGSIEMIVVPGVAFDHEGNRMGRGRGFYDRLLKSTPNALKVGVAFDFQIMESIPTEPFDVKMDRVISEN